MPFTLTSDDRIAMSRRLVKVDNEITFFNTANSNTASDLATFTQTDDMNKVLMDFYLGIATAYEDEQRALNGAIASTFDETDVLNSAHEYVGNLFYPNDFDTGTPNNPNLIPGTIDTDAPPDGQSDAIIDEVNGVIASNDYYPEQNLINFPPVGGQNSGDGIAQLIDILKTGFTPSASATTTLSSDYVDGSELMSVTSGSNIANGDYIIAKKTGSGVAGLFNVKNGGGTTSLVVYEIVSPNGNITVPVFPAPNDTVVTNSFSGFSNGDRQTLTTGSDLQNVLDGLTTSGTNCMIDKVLAWEVKVNGENSAISSNEEERSTQITQLTTATSNNNITIGVINTWQALANTGASGKFVDSSLNTLDTHISSRITTVSTRVTQIQTALGSVSDNSDGTVSFSDENDIYPKRWSAVNFRLHRSMGSLKKKVGLENSASMLDGMLDFLNTSKDSYLERMLATKLHSNPDGSTQIVVDDSTGFSNGDAVFLASETQSELSGVIRYINGNTIVLSFKVSADYTVLDLARLYKVL